MLHMYTVSALTRLAMLWHELAIRRLHMCLPNRVRCRYLCIFIREIYML